METLRFSFSALVEGQETCFKASWHSTSFPCCFPSPSTSSRVGGVWAVIFDVVLIWYPYHLNYGTFADTKITGASGFLCKMSRCLHTVFPCLPEAGLHPWASSNTSECGGWRWTGRWDAPLHRLYISPVHWCLILHKRTCMYGLLYLCKHNGLVPLPAFLCLCLSAPYPQSKYLLKKSIPA